MACSTSGEVVDPADAVTIGRRIGAAVCPRGPWTDDVIGAAVEAAWAHPDHPETYAWRRAVDELRRLAGRRRRVDSLDADVVGSDGLTLADRLAVEDPPPWPSWDGLTARQDRVVTLLAYGFDKVTTAHLLGVSAGTVSHDLAEIRARLAA